MNTPTTTHRLADDERPMIPMPCPHCGSAGGEGDLGGMYGKSNHRVHGIMMWCRACGEDPREPKEEP